jgi:glyoxylase-like metal-dependent hydrolase (beta-lactamase superfamily II)
MRDAFPMLARAIAAFATGLIASAAHAAPYPEPIELGPGVYLFVGAREEASRANGGHVANQGFIVAAEGVIVIDSGLSAAFARHMVGVIGARTAKPIALVILTWPMDEAIFGAAVFQERGAPVLAHEAAARLMAERCERCLAQRRKALGEELMAGTRVPRPDRVFRGSQTLALAGRRLDLIDEDGAAAPGSIAIWDPESGVLFAGGLASFGRIPDTGNGSLDAWIKALGRLAALPARTVVPAHGAPSAPAALGRLAAYLDALQGRTQQAYAAGLSLLEAPRKVAVEEYRRWALYETLHPRNVHHAYLALERRELEGEPPKGWDASPPASTRRP